MIQIFILFLSLWATTIMAEEEQENKKRSLSEQFKDSTKILGPVGSLFGFIGDVIQPIAPFIHVLTVILAIVSLVLLVFLLLSKRYPRLKVAAGFFSQSLVLTMILSFFWLLGANSEKGFFAENFEAVAQLQSGIVGEETSTEEVVVDQSILETQMRISIASNEIRKGSSGMEDHLVNATVLFNIGDFRQAEPYFDSVFQRKFIRYDLLRRYYEVVFHNYSGKPDSVNWKMNSLALTGNPLLKLAELDFLYDGLEYYIALNKTDLGDPLLLAFAQNMKARSLQADLNHLSHYEPYVMNHWIPLMKKNEKLLGKNLVALRKIFFDYRTAVERFVEGSTHPDDGHTIWGWHSFDPKDDKSADYMWNRLLRGTNANAPDNGPVILAGKVTDSFGVPVHQAVITDFDQFPSVGRADQVWMTTTDEQGKFQIRTRIGNLLRIDGSFADLELKDKFIIVSGRDSLQVRMERR